MIYFFSKEIRISANLSNESRDDDFNFLKFFFSFFLSEGLLLDLWEDLWSLFLFLDDLMEDLLNFLFFPFDFQLSVSHLRVLPMNSNGSERSASFNSLW